MFINFLNFDKTCGCNNQVYAIVKYDIEKDEPVRNENGFMIKVGLGEATAFRLSGRLIVAVQMPLSSFS